MQMSSSLTHAVTFLYPGKPLLKWFLLFAVIYCVTIYVVMTGLHANYPSIIRPRGTNTFRTLVLELSNDSVVQVVHYNSSSMEQVPGKAEDVPVLKLRGQVPRENSRDTADVMDVAVPLTETAWHQLRKAIKEAETAMFPWKLPRVRRVDCGKLFNGDSKELERARHFEQEAPVASMADKMVGSMANNCSSLKKRLVFITSSLTEEEKDFPIAYSLLVFKDAEQVLNLLRAIYRPQNYYCIHVDVKSDEEFRKAVSSVAACFHNVFLTSRSIDVRWGSFTVLEPELLCMEELWLYKKWKYFINLTGQEFPLRTNYELVRILTAYNGANNLEGTRKRANLDRWQSLGPPPWGITPTKGSVHIAVNRDFVDFVLHSKINKDFLPWIKKVGVPDEAFFSTLNHNPHLGILGTYTGEPETHPTNYPFLTRFKNWGTFPFDYPCASEKRVRMICILSSGDLPLLDSRPELFANKFYANESRVALDCLAQRIFNRTRDQFLGHVDFDVSYYASMPFVQNMVNESSFDRTV